MDNKPKWMVFYHNSNASEIQAYNVLKHSGVRKDIVKATKECKTKEEFSEKLRRTMMYYYWSKSEWEIIIGPWCGGNNTKEIKVDVYEQVLNNWDIFLEYVWNERKKICRWE